jgi:hypothetical protein
VIVLGCALTGCGGAEAEPPSRPAAAAATIDELRGTYRGVGLGDTRRKLERRLGRARVTRDGPFQPIGDDYYDVALPPTLDYPSSSGHSGIWRFRRAVVDAYDRRAFSLALTAPDAVTRRGVGVGSSLDDVRAAYPGARCGIANEGTEYPTSPFCTARVDAGRYVWFGGDPVLSVTLSRKPIGS